MKTSQFVLGLFFAAGIALAGSSACSSSGGDSDNGNGGNGGAGQGQGGSGNTGNAMGPGPGPGPGPGGNGPVGPGNGGGGMGGGPDVSTSCQDAPSMMMTMNNLGGDLFVHNDAITAPDDKDFFLLDVVAGNWYVMVTTANEMDDPAYIDTVLRVYDDTGAHLATGDDQFPRIDTDSEIFFRAPTTGTYCIEVLEWGDWAGTPVMKQFQNYDLAVIPMNGFSDLYENFDLDTEDNGTLVTAQVPSVTLLNNGQIFTQIMGDLENSAADEDWYQFDVPADGMPGDGMGFNMELTPGGQGNGMNNESGFGSTNLPGLVGLYDDGMNLLGEIDYNTHQPLGLEGFGSVPIQPSTTYFLRFQRPAGPVGANDAYAVKVFTSDATNPQEPPMEGTNDDINGSVTAMSVANGTAFSTFVGGTLDVEGDVDCWTFDPQGAPAVGQEIAVVCSSWASGSGVRGMEVTHIDDNNMMGTVTQSQEEDPAKGVLWSNAMFGGVTGAAITATTLGPHHICVENKAAVADGAASEKHYLCGFHVSTP